MSFLNYASGGTTCAVIQVFRHLGQMRLIPGAVKRVGLRLKGQAVFAHHLREEKPNRRSQIKAHALRDRLGLIPQLFVYSYLYVRHACSFIAVSMQTY
jgi:hypothetical protein